MPSSKKKVKKLKIPKRLPAKTGLRELPEAPAGYSYVLTTKYVKKKTRVKRERRYYTGYQTITVPEYRGRKFLRLKKVRLPVKKYRTVETTYYKKQRKDFWVLKKTPVIRQSWVGVDDFLERKLTINKIDKQKFEELGFPYYQFIEERTGFNFGERKLPLYRSFDTIFIYVIGHSSAGYFFMRGYGTSFIDKKDFMSVYKQEIPKSIRIVEHLMKKRDIKLIDLFCWSATTRGFKVEGKKSSFQKKKEKKKSFKKPRRRPQKIYGEREAEYLIEDEEE